MNFNRFLVQGFVGCVVMDFNRMSFSHFSDKTVADTNGIQPISQCGFEEFKYPAWISNAVIQIGSNRENITNLNHVLQCLQHLLCKHIVIDLDYKSTLHDVTLIMEALNNYNIHEAMFLMNYCDEFYSDEFADLILSSNRFSSMVIFDSPFDKNLENVVFYSTQSKNYTNLLKNKREFGCTPMIFVESKKYHTYFNRKMFIHKNGEISNAPESSEIYGKIDSFKTQEQLLDLVQSSAFQKLWHVKKESTDVCCDCEYRYMCVDNRIPLCRGNNEWYHEIECNYNPYIGKWQNENGYKTLVECGIRSGVDGFVKENESF